MQKDWLSFDDQLELLAGRGMCIEDEWGYRTLRVARVLTFRCAGAGKSVF